MTLTVPSCLHWVPGQPEIPPVTFKQSPHGGGGGAGEEVWAGRVGWSQPATLWLPYFKYCKYWKYRHTRIQNTVKIPE